MQLGVLLSQLGHIAACIRLRCYEWSFVERFRAVEAAHWRPQSAPHGISEQPPGARSDVSPRHGVEGWPCGDTVPYKIVAAVKFFVTF